MPKQILTQERLKELLYYAPLTGEFYRILSKYYSRIGLIENKANSHGYIEIQLDGIVYKAHRLGWLYIYGEWPEFEIDHINRVRGDNRITNLRDVSHSENLKNSKKMENNISGFTGVSWTNAKKKWASQIYIEGKNKHLGYYSDKLKAIEARKQANIKYGFHPNHGVTVDI